MNSSLKKLALKGTLWTVFGYGSSQIIRFISNIILTQLLLPEFFGIMAIVNTLRQGIELFTDIGIGQNIIRSEKGDDPDFLNTAWTLQILRGLLIWIILVLMAWPISRFYGEPSLFPVLLAVSVMSILGGLQSIKIYTFNRYMILGKVTLFELATRFVAIATMIVIAWINSSIWALIIGAIVGGIFKAIASYIVFPGHKYKLMLQTESSKEILSFGKWIFISSIIMFVAEQSDRIILGKIIPFELLGIYSIAYMFANIPKILLKQVSYKVIFPLISRYSDLPRLQLKSKLNRQRWKLHFPVSLIILILGGFGDLIIRSLYDVRYYQAAWMMPLLSLGSWFSVLFFLASPSLLALGKPVYIAQSRILRLVVVVFGLIIGFKLNGIVGAIIVISFSDLPAYLAIQNRLFKEGIDCLWQDIRASIFLIFMLIVIFTARIFLGLGSPFESLP